MLSFQGVVNSAEEMVFFFSISGDKQLTLGCGNFTTKGAVCLVFSAETWKSVSEKGEHASTLINSPNY